VQEWQFAIDDPTSPFNGQLLRDSWVTAPKNGQVHPKSTYYGYMTALFGGRAAPDVFYFATAAAQGIAAQTAAQVSGSNERREGGSG
jgi:hypothetical protein